MAHVYSLYIVTKILLNLISLIARGTLQGVLRGLFQCHSV